ncbi:MAG: hypothetical protein KAX20_07985 [Candidatus Omnitrophica bacterium]|nr:hypothetical protein [Candidatus Omnitrophota bacterium]
MSTINEQLDKAGIDTSNLSQELKESEGANTIDMGSLKEAFVRKKGRDIKKVEGTNAAMTAYKKYLKGQGRLTEATEKSIDEITKRGRFSTGAVDRLSEEAKERRPENFVGLLKEEVQKSKANTDKYERLVNEMVGIEKRYEDGEITYEELQEHADRIADSIGSMKAEDNEQSGVDLGVFFGK